MVESCVGLGELRFGAGEVVEDRAAILVAVERLDQQLLGLLVPAAVEHRDDVGVRLPGSRTVGLARPEVTRYSSSCPDGRSSCSGMIVAPGSCAVHALMPKASTPSRSRIGDQ